MEDIAREQRLNAALQRVREMNQAMDAVICLENACIFIGNVIKYPNEKKFRKIRRSNVNYMDLLGCYIGGEEVLQAVGFDVSGDHLVMDPSLYSEEQLTLRLCALKVHDVMKELMESCSCAAESVLSPSHVWSSVLAAGSHAERGLRKTMEDESILVDGLGQPRVAYFGLYDGHGGTDAARFVQDMLHKNVWHCSGGDLSGDLESCYRAAYLKTDEQMRKCNVWYSGTTCVSCLIADRTLHCANVGDSRAVLCRREEAVRLTLDHKPGDEAETKRIVELGGFVSDRVARVNGVLAVSRALGDHLLKPFVSAEPYYTKTQLQTHDLVLVLACDGLWDVCTDQEAVDAVLMELQSRTGESSLSREALQELGPQLSVAAQACAELLVRLALDRKSQDNVSVIVVVL